MSFDTVWSDPAGTNVEPFASRFGELGGIFFLNGNVFKVEGVRYFTRLIGSN